MATILTNTCSKFIICKLLLVTERTSMAKVIRTEVEQRYLEATLHVPSHYIHHLSIGMESAEAIAVTIDQQTIVAIFHEIITLAGVQARIRQLLDVYGIETEVKWTVQPIWTVLVSVETSDIEGLRNYLRRFIHSGHVSHRGNDTLRIHLSNEPTEATLQAITVRVSQYS